MLITILQQMHSGEIKASLLTSMQRFKLISLTTTLTKIAPFL